MSPVVVKAIKKGNLKSFVSGERSRALWALLYGYFLILFKKKLPFYIDNTLQLIVFLCGRISKKESLTYEWRSVMLIEVSSEGLGCDRLRGLLRRLFTAPDRFCERCSVGILLLFA